MPKYKVIRYGDSAEGRYWHTVIKTDNLEEADATFRRTVYLYSHQTIELVSDDPKHEKKHKS